MASAHPGNPMAMVDALDSDLKEGRGLVNAGSLTLIST